MRTIHLRRLAPVKPDAKKAGPKYLPGAITAVFNVGVGPGEDSFTSLEAGLSFCSEHQPHPVTGVPGYFSKADGRNIALKRLATNPVLFKLSEPLSRQYALPIIQAWLIESPRYTLDKNSVPHRAQRFKHRFTAPLLGPEGTVVSASFDGTVRLMLPDYEEGVRGLRKARIHHQLAQEAIRNIRMESHGDTIDTYVLDFRSWVTRIPGWARSFVQEI